MYFQKHWLRVALKKRGYASIYEFCKEFPQLHSTMLYQWDTMRRIITVGSLIKLCTYIKCTPNDLLLNSEEDFYYV